MHLSHLSSQVLAGYITGFIFLAAFAGKLFHFQRFVLVISKYRLLPVSIIGPFAYFTLASELAIGVCMILGQYIEASAYLAVTLLTVFTLAFTVGIIRGHERSTCGCFGVLGGGTNTWLLILRNVGLGVVAFHAVPSRNLADTSRSQITFIVSVGIVAVTSIWSYAIPRNRHDSKSIIPSPRVDAAPM